MIRASADRIADVVQEVATVMCESKDPPCNHCLKTVFDIVMRLMAVHGFQLPEVSNDARSEGQD